MDIENVTSEQPHFQAAAIPTQAVKESATDGPILNEIACQALPQLLRYYDSLHQHLMDGRVYTRFSRCTKRHARAKKHSFLHRLVRAIMSKSDYRYTTRLLAKRLSINESVLQRLNYHNDPQDALLLPFSAGLRLLALYAHYDAERTHAFEIQPDIFKHFIFNWRAIINSLHQNDYSDETLAQTLLLSADELSLLRLLGLSERALDLEPSFFLSIELLRLHNWVCIDSYL